jgi:hypothetical protein
MLVTRGRRRELQCGANDSQKGDPRFDTADFSDTAPGNLRADYVLPSRKDRHRRLGGLQAAARLTGVFDPANRGAVGGFPTSDHRLVWADLDLPNGGRHLHRR